MRARNEETLASLAGQVATMRSQVARCTDPALAEEAAMVLEQATMVVEAEEASMAADVAILLEAYRAQLEACSR